MSNTILAGNHFRLESGDTQSVDAKGTPLVAEYDVEDNEGNIGSCTQTIPVQDSNFPTFTSAAIPTPLNVESLHFKKVDTSEESEGDTFHDRRSLQMTCFMKNPLYYVTVGSCSSHSSVSS